ncbi:MAG: choice-of-anchor F family protein [Sulfurovum sp.]|nr:choice-of-anchor F family protein [Sulfurovum sp.]
MKTQNGKKILGLSLVTALLLGSSAYAGHVVGADAAAAYVASTPAKQFSFGGLNLENVTVNMVTGIDNVPIDGTFDPITGEYPQMALGDSYESSVFGSGDDKSDPATRLGYVVQKVWPISEPTGIKVVNNDTATSSGKPQNCIMGSSYQRYQNMDDDTSGSGFLDTTHVDGPKPVICSSDAGTSKRIQLILNQNVVANANAGEYGQYVDLVFNIDSPDGLNRYQVFQKVSNFTGKRLDGFTLEVLNSAGIPDANLTLSLGIGEEEDSLGDLTGGDLFAAEEMAFYPPGLWGDGSKKHLPIGWFDSAPSGYYVSLNEANNTMTSADVQFGGNYVPLFGNWQPDKWVAWGMHIVIDPLEEPELIAYWGNHPDRPDEAPAWYYGMDHNLTDGVDTNFTTPSQAEIDKWEANPEKYVIDDIEDLPNISLNYIVNVGVGIDNNFTIRVTPKVSVDQTPPSYISKDDNESYIVPPQLWVKPTADAGPDKTVQVNETVTITGTGTDSDGEIVSYEWKYGTEIVATTASFDHTPDTVEPSTFTLTVTDNNGLKGTDSMNLTVTAVPVVTPPAVTPPIYIPSSSGGGCTYNPNSKSFDMTFLLIMGLGLLYPFRRRFLK